MSKFEQVGCNNQMESRNKKEAVRRFSRSCDICCNRGLNIECSRCAIAVYHKLTVAAFETVAKTEMAT